MSTTASERVMRQELQLRLLPKILSCERKVQVPAPLAPVAILLAVEKPYLATTAPIMLVSALTSTFTVRHSKEHS